MSLPAHRYFGWGPIYAPCEGNPGQWLQLRRPPINWSLNVLNVAFGWVSAFGACSSSHCCRAPRDNTWSFCQYSCTCTFGRFTHGWQGTRHFYYDRWYARCCCDGRRSTHRRTSRRQYPCNIFNSSNSNEEWWWDGSLRRCVGGIYDNARCDQRVKRYVIPIYSYSTLEPKHPHLVDRALCIWKSAGTAELATPQLHIILGKRYGILS